MNENARLYRIVRMFEGDRKSRTIKSGLTLEEAQEHCRKPETSSTTATGSKAKRYTKVNGPWFDGYDYMKGCRPKG